MWSEDQYPSTDKRRIQENKPYLPHTHNNNNNNNNNKTTNQPSNVFRQECMWMNALLCHIRQNVDDVYHSLLAGPEAFHYDLHQIIHSLHAEQVPAVWLHPNTQPSTHSLASWQTRE